jgi:hypothetical protein
VRYDTLCIGCKCPASACECGDEYPWIECPRCHDSTKDMDGFGFLACDKCGYCTHPCSSGDPLTCGICGAVELTP